MSTLTDEGAAGLHLGGIQPLLHFVKCLLWLLRPTKPMDHARRLTHLAEGAGAKDPRVRQLLDAADAVLVQQGQDNLLPAMICAGSARVSSSSIER